MGRTKWKQVALESMKENARLIEDWLKLSAQFEGCVGCLEHTRKELAESKVTIQELEACLRKGWAEECQGLTEIINGHEKLLEELLKEKGGDGNR